MIAPNAVSAPAEVRDYRFVANGALKCSLILLLVKSISALWLNLQLGGTVSINRWAQVVPYMAFHLDPANFTRVTTFSTVLTSVVSAILLGRRFVRPDRSGNGLRRTAATLPAVIGTVWLVAIDLFLHFTRRNYIQPRWMLMPVAVVLVQVVVAAAFINRHGDAVSTGAIVPSDHDAADELPRTSPLTGLSPASPLLPASSPTSFTTPNPSTTTPHTTGVQP
jgi:uncharacterized membrane protein SirB2